MRVYWYLLIDGEIDYALRFDNETEREEHIKQSTSTNYDEVRRFEYDVETPSPYELRKVLWTQED